MRAGYPITSFDVPLVDERSGRPFFLAGGALLLGIPVYLARRGKMTQPQAVPECR